ncbi:MAG: alkaline phosphatase family protein [Flavobacteriales bacterium]|nr:alkaline phosphatase family protein [Flavobacteriales bacterium]
MKKMSQNQNTQYCQFFNCLAITLRMMVVPLLLLSTSSAYSQTEKKVLIIGIDGTRSDALEFANTPNIDGLIANGLYSPDALSDDITISGPAWSSILTGVWADKHLVTGNGFANDDFDTYPTLFTYIEEYNPNLNTASICHWSPINNNIIQGATDFSLNVSSDAELSSEVVDYLTNQDPDCMFIHFDEVDGAGHGNGFSVDVPQYIAAIENVDLLIGPILTAIEQRPNYSQEDWLILLTTDHGGLNTSHGGTSIDEQKVFFIVSGNSVPQQLLEASTITITDDPFNCLGEEIPRLDFIGTDDRVEVPSSSLFDFGDSQDFTVECRVRTQEAADVSIVGNKDWDSGFFPGFVFSFVFPNGPGWKVNIGDGSNRVDLNSGGEIADNEWHTLSVTFDRDGMMTMYEDGVFVDEASISGIGNINTGAGLFFGTDIDSEYDFSGSIAEVRVWDTVLDEQEINNWNCSSLDASHPNYESLIGYWKMDEGEPAINVEDSSPNNNDGVIVNAIWNEGDVIIVDDYSGTPRIADIPATALTHFCIPIDPSWELDGISWIEACLVVGCTGDFNSDGEVDVEDLLVFLSSFGCDDQCGQTDINGNGVVDAEDMLTFLVAFGNPCFPVPAPIQEVENGASIVHREKKDHANYLFMGLQSCLSDNHFCKHGGQKK